MTIPIEISARHIHLSSIDLVKLFGKNYSLKCYANLSQPGQFAAKETVDIISHSGQINKVRVLGPVREETQLEISFTDCHVLGINIPLRISGDLTKSGGKVTIVGPSGKINLSNGVIVASRHLHIEPELAKKYNIKNGQIVGVKIPGPRALIFNNVLVRSKKDIDKLSFQIDFDEANAAGVTKGAIGELIV